MGYAYGKRALDCAALRDTIPVWRARSKRARRLPYASAYIIIRRVDNDETRRGNIKTTSQGSIRAEVCEWLTRNGLS